MFQFNSTFKKILTSTVLSLCAFTLYAQKEQEVKITVDTDFVIEDNYFGGAVQWEPNDRDTLPEWKWQRLLNRVRELKLGYIRCCIRSEWYCLDEKGDTPTYIWDQDAPAKANYSFALSRMNDLYRILDFCQAEKIDVMLGEWQFKQYNLESSVRNIGASLKHLYYDKKYTCIKNYNWGNEVNLNNIPFQTWSHGIKALKDEIREIGLNGKITIVGPDAGYWSDLWFSQTLEHNLGDINTLDYHWYIDNAWLLKNTVEDEMRLMEFFTSLKRKEMPLVFGEVGIRDGHDERFDQQTRCHEYWYGVSMANVVIESMRAGWSAITAWDMDDAMHFSNPEKKVLKIWGFWNSLGTEMGDPQQEKIRPWFYAWAILSRNFPKGSKILYTSPTLKIGLNSVAAITKEGDLSMAIENTSDDSKNVIIEIPNIQEEITLNQYIYTENNIPVERNNAPRLFKALKNKQPKNGIEVEAPANSLIMLTTIGTEKEFVFSPDTVLFTDPMTGIQRMFHHSSNLGFNGFCTHPNERFEDRSFNFHNFDGNHCTLHRSTDKEKAEIVYKWDNWSDFSVTGYGRKGVEGKFAFYGSSDNVVWNKLDVCNTPEISTTGMFFKAVFSPVIGNKSYNYLKIEFMPVMTAIDSRITEVKISKQPLK